MFICEQSGSQKSEDDEPIRRKSGKLGRIGVLLGAISSSESEDEEESGGKNEIAPAKKEKIEPVEKVERDEKPQAESSGVEEKVQRNTCT